MADFHFFHINHADIPIFASSAVSKMLDSLKKDATSHLQIYYVYNYPSLQINYIFAHLICVIRILILDSCAQNISPCTKQQRALQFQLNLTCSAYMQLCTKILRKLNS